MALSGVANEDMLVNFSNTSPGVPPLVYSGDQGIDATKIVPVKSTHCKAGGKFICTESITITWTALNVCPHAYAGHTFVSGAGSISATATKTKADGKFVLRKDDNGTCVGSWTNDSSGATVVCECDVSISNAGQTKVKAQ